MANRWLVDLAVADSQRRVLRPYGNRLRLLLAVAA